MQDLKQGWIEHGARCYSRSNEESFVVSSEGQEFKGEHLGYQGQVEEKQGGGLVKDLNTTPRTEN